MEKDFLRKNHIINIFKEQKIENYEFIKAINGNQLSEEYKNHNFDRRAFIKLNAKVPNNSQIGCSLSHQLCYKKQLENDDEWSLILEDDILVPEDFKLKLESIINKISIAKKPTILLLSGWFWYINKNYSKDLSFKKVYSGFLAHAYLINNSAARILSTTKPFYAADDWYNIRKIFNISIYGFVPHLINQDWSDRFESSTKSLAIDYENGYMYAKLRILIKVIVQRILKKLGNFEEAI